MLTLAEGKKDGKEFISMAPGYFPDDRAGTLE